MSGRRLPWLVFALTVAMFAVALIVARDPVEGEPIGWDAIWLLPFLAYGGVGAVVSSHRPENRIGWVFLAIGVFGALAVVGVMGEVLGGAGDSTPARTVMILLSFAGWFGGLGTMVTLALLLFPDGRLPGPRWGPVVWAVVVTIPVAGVSEYLASELVAPPEALVSVAQLVGAIALFVLLAAALASVASVVVRFRRSRGDERQQLKWFTYAAGVLAVGIAVITVVEIIHRPDQQTAPDLAVTAFFVLTITGIPVSAGIAILKYRLYDIDRVINQTVVYGLLTAALVGIYVGAVAGIGSVARALTGQETNSLVIVVSTLAVAALFRPLRARFQSFIDRRFYRQRYDAAATLDAFSTHLRDQVDLESLRDEIVAVVGTTMQPAHASVWLRSGGKRDE